MGRKQLHLVKRMIRGLGSEQLLTYSQTLNGYEGTAAETSCALECQTHSGPFLVSRTGDAG